MPRITLDVEIKNEIERNCTVVQPDTLKKIIVKFSKRLQRHLATLFCPDMLVAQSIFREPSSVRGLAGFLPEVLVTTTIFQAIPLSSLVSLKDIKAPRAAAPRSVRSLAGFRPDHTSYLSREPREYPCNFFLAGVNFYRFNAKNWQFTV